MGEEPGGKEPGGRSQGAGRWSRWEVGGGSGWGCNYQPELNRTKCK